MDEPILHAYAAPEPSGFREAGLALSTARHDQRLGEFVLPCDAVRSLSV